MKRSIKALVVITSFWALLPAVVFAASLATDNAADPAYSGGWTNGSNGGTGWLGPWFLNRTAEPGGGSTSNSHFIASSTNNNASGDTNLDGDIDTAGVAFGMYGAEGFATGVRFFDGSLTNGQKFVIEMDNGSVQAGGKVGFVLQTAGYATRLEFALNGGDATYSLTGLGSATGIPVTDEGLRIEVEPVDIDHVNLTVTTLITGTNYVFNNFTLDGGTTGEDIVQVNIVNINSGAGATNDVYFNSLAIAAVNGQTQLILTQSAVPAPVVVGANLTYTLAVTNNGPETATAVTVTDPLPAGVTFISATPTVGTAGTNDVGTVTFNAGDLASNAVAAVDIVVATSSPAILTNIATLTALNLDAGTSTSVATNVTTVITGAGLVVNPGSLNFGTVPVGVPTQLSFVITNTGETTLTGSATVGAGPFAISSGSPFAVAGFDTTNLVVTFTPAGDGSASNDVIFTSNGGDSTNVVTGIGATVPTANFSGTPTNGLAPLAVTFTDTSTGSITDRFWSFGDGGTTNTTATSVAHTYNLPGTNTVRLIVSGPLGVSTNSKAAYIIVTNIPAAQVVSPGSRNFGAVAVGQTSTQAFTVVNTGSNPLIGTASSAAPFAIVSGGSYNLAGGETGVVSVTFSPVTEGVFSNTAVFASNAGDATNTVTGTGYITLVAGFTASPTNGAVALLVNFTDASTGTITSRSWDFGDGGSSSAVSPSHTYTNAGTFTVSLTLIGPGGTNTATQAGLIHVSSPNAPVVTILSPADGMQYPLVTNLVIHIVAEASSVNGISKLEFFDGVNKIGEATTALATNVWDMPAVGLHTLTVVATDTLGGTNTSAPVTILVGTLDSPLGTWEITIKGDDKGIGYYTFLDDFTWTGYAIRNGVFGLSELTGTWDKGADSEFPGTYLETTGSETNSAGTIMAKVTNLTKISGAATATDNLVFKWKGIPVSSYADLSGAWTGTAKVGSQEFNVSVTITADENDPGVFNVQQTGNLISLGQLIVTAKNKINGYLAIEENQASISGTFKSPATLKLKGAAQDGSKVKIQLSR